MTEARRLSADESFVGLVRTRAFTIIGFVEMMTDERLRLSPGRRAEYAVIVRDEISALDREVRLYYRLPPQGSPN